MAQQVQWRPAAKAYVGAPPVMRGSAAVQPRSVAPVDHPMVANCQRPLQPMVAQTQRLQARPHMTLPAAHGSQAHAFRPQLVQQVARPISVQMAAQSTGPAHAGPPPTGGQFMPEPRRWEPPQLQKERSAPIPTQVGDSVAHLSTPQLVQLCKHHTQSLETKKQILAENVKEQGRLLKERDALRKRAQALEGALSAATGPLSIQPAKEVEGPVVAPAQVSTQAPAAQMAKAVTPEPATLPRASPTVHSGAATSPALAVGGDFVNHTARSAEVSQSAAPDTPAEPCRPSLLATLPAQQIPSSAVDRLLASQPAQRDHAGPGQSPDGQLSAPSSTAPHPTNTAAFASLSTCIASSGELPTSVPTHATYDTLATALPAVSLPTPRTSDSQPTGPLQQPQLPLHEVVTAPIQQPDTALSGGAELHTMPLETEPEQTEQEIQESVAARSPVSSPAKPTSPEEAAGVAVSPGQLGSPQPPVKPIFTAFSESPSSPSQLPCSGDAAAGVGGPVAEESKASPHALVLGSLDGSSVVPDCDNLASKEEGTSPQAPTPETVAAPAAHAVTQPQSPEPQAAKMDSVPIPEEVMARALPDGTIRLTWFFDEELLEQLSSGSPNTLSFEICQKSETMGGHVRIRQHSCHVRLPFKDGLVQEQFFIVEGCAPGRPYSFSVRSCLESSSGSTQVSDYSDPVTCSAAGLAGSVRGPLSLSSTLTSTQAAQEMGVVKGDGAILVPREATGSGPVESPPCSLQKARDVQPFQAAKPELRSDRLLPDEGCRLRQWLTDKLNPSPGSTAASTAKSPAGGDNSMSVKPASAQQAGSPPQLQTDHSFLRRWLQDRQLPAEVVQPAAGSPAAGDRAAQAPVAPVAPLNKRVQEESAEPDAPVLAGLAPVQRSAAASTAASYQPLRSDADVDITRLPADQGRVQVPGAADRRHETNPPSCPDFRVHVRADGTFIGAARSQSFGGVERRQTLASGQMPGQADMPRSVRHCQAFSPVSRDVRGQQLPMSISIAPPSPSGSFASQAGLSRPADALTTVTSLPQAGGTAWKTGQPMAQDPFQTRPLQSQGQSALLAPFGGMGSSDAANYLFGPINPNPFGTGAIGTTRPFNFSALGGSMRDAPSGNFFAKQSSTPTSYMSRGIDEEQSRPFDPPPPPRSAPSLYGDSSVQSAPMQQAQHPQQSIPWNEPRRGASGSIGGFEAVQSGLSGAVGGGVGVTQNLGSLDAQGLSRGNQARYELRVRMSDSHWESLRFSAGDDLDFQGRQFIQRLGLKSAFLSGLVARLRQMASIQQDYACVDVVDLI